MPTEPSTHPLAARPSTTSEGDSAARTLLGGLACAWGIAGVLLLLGYAILRLSVTALDAFG